MKKILVILFGLFSIQNVCAINASSYIVYNMNQNQIMMGNNIHTPRLIASVSKIMTCIVAIENGNLDDIVTINVDSLKVTGSSLYLSLNERISLRDLLYGLMLRSGNDAAVAVSLSVSGSMDEFVKLMNEYAKKLGMYDTTFYNSHGLELNNGLGNISSAYDLAILTKYAMKNKTFQKIFSTKEYTCKTNLKTYTWFNKNKLLKYDYITGGKTGYTLKAKRTLVTTAHIHNQDIVIVTLNDPDDFIDHLNVYEDIKNNFIYYHILDKKSFLNDLKKLNIVDNYYIKNDYYLFMHKKDVKNINVEYHFNSDNSNPIGYINVLYNDDILHKETIYKSNKKSVWYQRIWQYFLNLFK